MQIANRKSDITKYVKQYFNKANSVRICQNKKKQNCLSSLLITNGYSEKLNKTTEYDK